MANKVINFSNLKPEDIPEPGTPGYDHFVDRFLAAKGEKPKREAGCRVFASFTGLGIDEAHIQDSKGGLGVDDSEVPLEVLLDHPSYEIQGSRSYDGVYTGVGHVSHRAHRVPVESSDENWHHTVNAGLLCFADVADEPGVFKPRYLREP